MCVGGVPPPAPPRPGGGAGGLGGVPAPHRHGGGAAGGGAEPHRAPTCPYVKGSARRFPRGLRGLPRGRNHGISAARGSLPPPEGGAGPGTRLRAAPVGAPLTARWCFGGGGGLRSVLGGVPGCEEGWQWAGCLRGKGAAGGAASSGFCRARRESGHRHSRVFSPVVSINELRRLEAVQRLGGQQPLFEVVRIITKGGCGLTPTGSVLRHK